MKIINNRLEEIKNKEIEATMLEINSLVIDFLNNTYNNLGQRYKLDKKIDELIIEIMTSNKEKYTVLYNDVKHHQSIPNHIAAFVTKIS